MSLSFAASTKFHTVANNKEHTIVNRIYNRPNYDYRRTFEMMIKDNQRKNNIVQVKGKMNIDRK